MVVDKKKAYDRIYAYYIKKGYSHEDAHHVATKVADGQK